MLNAYLVGGVIICYNFMMDKIEKTKRVILIILGFVLSGYLIYSGFNMLKNDENSTPQEQPQHNSQ